MSKPYRGIMSVHLKWLREAADLLEKAQSKLGDVFEKTPQPWVSERVSVAMERLHDIEYYLASNLIGALEGNPRARRTKRRTGLIKDVRFFRGQGGGVVGHATQGALELARAERYAKQHGWVVTWEPDQDADLSWMDDEERAKPHEVWVAVLWDRDPVDTSARTPEARRAHVLASLGGIVDPSNQYQRVVEAELALEASDRASRRRAR